MVLPDYSSDGPGLNGAGLSTTISCNRETFSSGCLSSFGSRSGVVAGGRGAGESGVEGAELSFDFASAVEAPSWVREDFQGRLRVERAGRLPPVLLPGRREVEGFRPLPRPEAGRRPRPRLSPFSSGDFSLSGRESF